MALIEAERIAGIAALKDAAFEADNERRTKERTAEQKQADELAKTEASKQAALEATKAVQVEAGIAAGISAAEQADSAEDAAKALANSARQIIKAELSKAVAIQIVKALRDVPFPVNFIVAGVAGAAISTLFDSLIPAFAGGGIVGNGGIPIQRSNGDNRLATVRTGEVVVNRKQRAKIGDGAFRKAGVPGFAGGGVVGASVTGASVSSEVASTDAIINGVAQAVQGLPSPVLDYKEFTTFTSRVTLKENRASL